ncbi:Transcription elongation factor spt6 [Glutinoglossum americanum]|uniref:Transcription elongation factor Spt6 n=1 Tax=Glutinoglossum americanum TaxID=1670608 RepID=A0A9P8L3K6_9PEZI|nr:Transcription elongation factor spt6 [Glutinoglossum americanum]
MDARDLIEGEAELDDVEAEDSYDGDTREPIGRGRDRLNGAAMQDSSEEEDDDDDEEAARAVREGFIVDEDEEEEEERDRRKRREKKRRRAQREEEEEALDEEDLDLIGEANPEFERRVASQPKFKRLKRGREEDRGRAASRGLEEIFSDDEDIDAPHDLDEDDRRGPLRAEPRALADEFADFIEEDELSDEDERQRQLEEREIARPRDRDYGGVAGTEATGLDEETLETMTRAFGNGEDYEWALQLEEDLEEKEIGEQQLELKDVFEPSQLAERMLTDEDNQIRATDEPERFQLARKPFKHVILTDEQFKEEAKWISDLMLPKKGLDDELVAPFERAIGKVLEFFVTDEVEVPYVFQHRKDYLIHAAKSRVTPDPFNPDAPQYVVKAEKLLNQNDLWDILEFDLKFRALVDKRNALQRTYDQLKRISDIQDDVFEDMLPKAVSMEELQDIQDYLHFQYSSQLKDIALVNGAANGAQRRPNTQRTLWERIRNGKIYSLVRAFGITADQFGQNVLREGRRQYTEDPTVLPNEMADTDGLLEPPEHPTGVHVLKAAKLMFAEEIAMNPRMRKALRGTFYVNGVVESFRTEKGLKKIDEQHPYHEFKYLRNQDLRQIARRPDMYLRMLKAEEEGLVEVKIRLKDFESFKRKLADDIESDNFSEVADAWNNERREVLEMALSKLEKIMTKGVKENMKTECENEVSKACRAEYSKKLDQAPYKPNGMILGTTPRVLAISGGNTEAGRGGGVCWAWVEEDGRVLENGKFSNLNKDEDAKRSFVELVQRRRPDVIGVAGFTVATHTLYLDIRNIILAENLRGTEFEDPETGEERTEPLEVVMVNDEVARLYHCSERAAIEHPGLSPLGRYCVALAKYLQNPMKEYAALQKDVVSISFHPNQQLVPQEKILRQLETAMVDMVNLCGVDINEAVSDPYTANLLPYICGLGFRKTSSVIKAINVNGGVVASRDELVGDPEEGKLPVVGPRVWHNCASFLYIEYDPSDTSSDYLDNTRVHPEDYDLGRKMAADALELDEEDVKAEIDEAGPGAIVRKLIKDGAQEKVNDLILEEYAEQLERNFNQRKRATLETIRAELQQPYEELRRTFTLLSPGEIFTMLTGETSETLCEGMIVPVSIRKVLDKKMFVKLDCGIEVEASLHDTDADQDQLTSLYSANQVMRARILNLDRANFKVVLSLREDDLRRPFRRHLDHMPDEWDDLQEDRDKELLQETNEESRSTQRVIKHPLFRPFNAAQAEQYLATQARGDAVIRPSSKGLDHLAVTWKVSDGVYQHIDVLELDKENEFSVGKSLRIGLQTYSDLDELIVNHVKAMARKVEEMMLHEKYQSGSKADTERWLTTYTEANPTRSVYAFCINPKYPGYFYLCFKAGPRAQMGSWPVKVIPQAFGMQKHVYPDMRALCNGFKLVFQNMQSNKRR